jgi:hypothetical protein
MKQMQFMQSLTKQFSSHIDHSHINFDACGVTTHHTEHEQMSFCGLLNFDLVSLNFDSDIFALSEVLMVEANLSSIGLLVSSDCGQKASPTQCHTY